MSGGKADSLRAMREAQFDAALAGGGVVTLPCDPLSPWPHVTGTVTPTVTKTVTLICADCAAYHERGHRHGMTAAERQREARARRKGAK